MKLTAEEVRHVALLARLGVTEAELEKFSHQLSHILENFEILQEVDTTDIEPTAHSIPIHTVLREDQARPSLSPEEVLANAPYEEDGHFRVKAVLE
jgi:aspartyl-tRNA(Asn)/glutamyl-tRNA(Gln) amidotransferase subunit C